MSNPLVSVIIPVYNRSNIISIPLDSLKKQTYKNLEVIIVDDCSSDSANLIKVLDLYSSCLNLKYHRNVTNLHGGGSRNVGIELSIGEYVAFLDSDDVFNMRKIEICVGENVDNKTILYSRLKNGNRIKPVFAYENDNSVDEYLIVKRESMQTSTLFMKSELAREVLFDANLVRFQDLDFIIRAEKEYGCQFYFVEDVLIEMLDGAGSRISRSRNHLVAIDWIESVKHLISNRAYEVFYFNRILNYACYNLPFWRRFKYISLVSVLRNFNYLDKKVFLKLILPLNRG